MNLRHLPWLTYPVVYLMLAAGCQSGSSPTEQTESLVVTAAAEQTPSPQRHQQHADDIYPAAATITFETTINDLGRIGFGASDTCEFRFNNTGRAPLKITNISKTCGCTVARLEKRQYAPGETGSVQVSFTASRASASLQKDIYVSTNDPNNPRVKLTIKADVIQMVEADPPRLQIYPRKPNGGIGGIRLTSKKGDKFSVSRIQTSAGDVLRTESAMVHRAAGVSSRSSITAARSSGGILYSR